MIANPAIPAYRSVLWDHILFHCVYMILSIAFDCLLCSAHLVERIQGIIHGAIENLMTGYWIKN